MKNSIIHLCLIVITLASCSKDCDLENNTQDPTTPDLTLAEGVWQGYFEQPEVAGLKYEYPTSITIEGTNENLSGGIFQNVIENGEYLLFGSEEFGGLRNIESTPSYQNDNEVYLDFDDGGSSFPYWCEQLYTELTLSDDGKSLTGSFTGTDNGVPCVSGDVTLKRLIIKSNLSLCVGESIELEGTNIKWYSDLTFNDLIATGSKYEVSGSGTQKVYITQTFDGIESSVYGLEYFVEAC